MKSYPVTFLMAALAAVFVLSGTAAALTVNDINIHGFVSQGYLHSNHGVEFLIDDSDEGSLEFNEMAINFSTELEDNLSLGLQLAAFDLGDIGNDEVMVDWAFGNYSYRDYLNFRAGIMKTPFGLYNETRKIDMVRTSILLPNSVYPEWFREAFARIKGAGLHGTLPGNISYQAMYGRIDLDADGGLASGLETLLGNGLEITDTETDFAYAGKVQWDSPFGLKLAASLYTLDKMEMTAENMVPLSVFNPAIPAGVPTLMSTRLNFEPVENYVFSAEYMIDRLTLAAEYAEYNLEFEAITTAPLLGAMSPSMVSQVETTMQGYYGSASYRLLDNLEVGAYYSELYFDKDDHDGEKFAAAFGTPRYDAWLKDACLSLRYDITGNWCAKLEGHLMDGTFMGKTTTDQDWALYAAKLTYSF